MKNQFLFTCLIISNISLSQSGAIDSTFNTMDAGRGLTGYVYTITELPNDKYLIAGELNVYQDQTVNRITLLDSAARRLTTFNSGTGLNNGCFASAYRSDGKLVVGGIFTEYNGTSAQRIAVINMDGSVDSSFTCWNGANGKINTVQTQTDNKVIVGGLFTEYAGVNHGRFARLTLTGAIDNSFQTGTGFDAEVKSIEIQVDGKILVGGNFSSYNGTACNRIVRLNIDGTVDTTFNIGYGFNGSVSSISYNSVGQIAVAGTFTLYDSIPAKKIVVLENLGGLVTSFQSGTSYSSTISQIDFDTDTTIVVGTLTGGSYNGTSCQTNSRLHITGVLDSNYSASQMYQVLCVKALSSQKIMFGGFFNEIYQHVRTNITRVNANGVPDFSFTPYGGAYGSVSAIHLAEDGKIYTGGSFNNFNGKFSQRMARLNGNGLLDFGYTTGVYALGNYGYGSVKNIQTLSNGIQYACGNFDLTNNSTNNSYSVLMRVNASGTPQNIDYNVYKVYDMDVQAGDKLIFGGEFTFVTGIYAKNICRLKADGTFDNTFISGTGFNDDVNCLEILEDNKIIIGGAFTAYNGGSYSRICRLNPNGSIDTSFLIGTGANGPVRLMDVSNDGKIILVGDFTTFNGVSKDRMVQLNPDGSVDLGFDAGTLIDNLSTISSVAYQKDGKVIIGGDFLSVQGSPYNRIAKLNQNGVLDATFNIGTGFNGPVYSLAVKQDGTVLAGGNFHQYNNYNRTRFAGIKDQYNNAGIDSIHSCMSSYTWIDGNVYTSSNNTATHTLENISGGDSLVYLNLTIGAPTSSNISISTCDEYTIGGNTYTSSGIYYPIIQNASGCDSAVTLDLIVNHSMVEPLTNISSCDNYTWPQNNITYTNSGIFYDTLQAINGCDSILGINLTINSSPNPLANIDALGSIYVNSLNNQYEWYNCDSNTVISNSNVQNFIPMTNGNYACIVTNASNCSDTSNCVNYNFVGLNEINSNTAQISPNPSNKFVKIDFISDQKAHIVLYDLTGKIVLTKMILANEIIHIENLEIGVYILNLTINNYSEIFKLIKN